MEIKQLTLENLEVRSFVTNLDTKMTVIRGGYESYDPNMECHEDIDSGHEICTLDSCI